MLGNNKHNNNHKSETKPRKENENNKNKSDLKEENKNDINKLKQKTIKANESNKLGQKELKNITANELNKEEDKQDNIIESNQIEINNDKIKEIKRNESDKEDVIDFNPKEAKNYRSNKSMMGKETNKKSNPEGEKFQRKKGKFITLRNYIFKHPNGNFNENQMKKIKREKGFRDSELTGGDKDSDGFELFFTESENFSVDMGYISNLSKTYFSFSFDTFDKLSDLKEKRANSLPTRNSKFYFI